MHTKQIVPTRSAFHNDVVRAGASGNSDPQLNVFVGSKV